MTFAENNRISHRQLYRQMILTFLAPFLLCLFGKDRILGISGIAGTAAAVVLLVFYVIFLIRLAPYYADLPRFTGPFFCRVIGLFFLIYTLLTGAYLLAVLRETVSASLLTGISGNWLAAAAVLVCGFGTHRGMQRRGRMAEVSGALILGSIVLMMILCLGQSRMEYLQEMVQASGFEGGSFVRNGYGILCAFAGVGLLPFVLEDVEKQGSAGKTAVFGILTLGGIVLGMLLLLPAVFGWRRLQELEYPVLPLLAGADLPGNVLARFDILWIGFLLYSLLFAIGSLFHYGHQIIRKTQLGTGRFWMVIAVYGLSILRFGNVGIEDYFGKFLGYIFVPGLLLIQVFIMLRGKGYHRKKSALAVGGVLSMILFMGGCSGVEPEKRMFPLALGVDYSENGYSLIYGTPDLPKATGQEKPEETAGTAALMIKGAGFGEIEAAYNRSQEKYLDMGHLQVIIFGNSILEGYRWMEFLDYLEQEPFVGENVYLFRTEDPTAVLEWKESSATSVGEYLTGLLENRTSGQQRRGITLRQAYHERYRSGTMPVIPEVVLANGQIEVFLE